MIRKFTLLSILSVLFGQFVGCVSIRQSHPSQVRTIANFDDSTLPCSSSEDCCELYDRREAMSWIANKLNPVQLVPSSVLGWMGSCKVRSSAWVSNQCGRCDTAKGAIQGWIQSKKDEANAPPWPRFHPVPVRNVFESQATEAPAEPLAPDVYGRFGKG